MSKLTYQIQVATDEARSMVRATWPRAVKVMQDGIDRTLLGEMVDHGLELVVGRYVFPESGDPGEVDARVTKLLSWADENLQWLKARGVRVVLEVPYNEELQNGEALDRLNTLTIKAMTRIAGRGYDVGIGVFSEGNPSGDPVGDPFVDWPRFHPALREARKLWLLTQTRVFLCLHEYSIPALGPVDGWHAFRYRRVWERLPEDCKIPILITESGIDGGIEGRKKVGWRGYDGWDARKYANDFLWPTRAQLAKDDYVWFSFVFLCGTTEDRGWTKFDVRDEVDLRPVFVPGSRSVQWKPAQEAPVPTDLRTLASGIIRAFGLDEAITFRQITAESSWNPKAVSPSGAKGLMQLMDATARELGVVDPFDPRQNLTGGCKYMSWLLRKYGGSYRKALVAYNWGPGNLDRLLATNPADWESGISAQAKRYLEKIKPPAEQETWPNGRVKASTEEYDRLVWTPLFEAYKALANGGNGDLGDDVDATAILNIKRRNEVRHGVNR